MRKRLIFYIGAALISCILIVFSAYIVIIICLKWSEYTGHNFNLSDELQENKIIKKLFIKEDYKQLMIAISQSKKDTFNTTWDFNSAFALSKDMFINTEMFGMPKYRYRPRLGIYNVRVWNGLVYQPVAMVATPEVTALLKKNKVIHNVFFETDDNGLKKTAFTWDPTSLTILFLGDSFTEGWWVATENTFVNLFGRQLKSNGIRATPINLGVLGYSVLEEAWMFEHYAPLFHPKIAVFNLFPNDVHWDFLSVLKGKNIPESNYNEMFGYLQRIEDFCKIHNILPIISVIPPKEQFGTLRGYSVFQDRVKAWAEARGLTYLDPRNYFDTIGADKIYFPWDAHFSPEGHKYYADFLYQKLAPLIKEKFE